MNLAGWMLIGTGIAWIAQILATSASMGARDLIAIAIGGVVSIAGLRLLHRRQNAWRQALTLSLGLASISAFRAIFVAYISWPIQAAPAETRFALIWQFAWNAGLAITLGAAAVSIMLERRRVSPISPGG